MQHTANMHEKHTFALYYAPLSQGHTLRIGTVVTITDAQVVHRITHVLRLSVSDTVLIFDRQSHALCQVTAMSKKQVTCTVLSYAANTQHQPAITVLLPILKRDALEQALYACVELGATAVQLVMSDKVQKAWGGQGELQRLENIMIAAAEQSKNCALPTLAAPVTLASALQKHGAGECKILFAIHGNPLLSVLTDLHTNPPQSLVITLGPEGDFTSSEYDMLKQQGFASCALTPTVLRSYQALIVGLGAIRSV